METETKVMEVLQNVEEKKLEETVIQKFEEINLEVDENPETSPKVTNLMKRSGMFNFFRFKSKSIDNLAVENSPKVPKSNTLMRMFNKKDKIKDVEKEEVNSEDAPPRRSFIMRGIVNCQIVPWISRQTSQMNIHKPLEVAEINDDDIASPQEVATSSQIF